MVGLGIHAVCTSTCYLEWLELHIFQRRMTMELNALTDCQTEFSYPVMRHESTLQSTGNILLSVIKIPDKHNTRPAHLLQSHLLLETFGRIHYVRLRKQGIVRQTGALPKSGRRENNERWMHNLSLAPATDRFFLGKGYLKSNTHSDDSNVLNSFQSERAMMLRWISRRTLSEQNEKAVKKISKNRPREESGLKTR